MESKSQAMEKAIDGQYYCEHPDKISSTMLYLFGCFIIFIIAYWISNNLVNRLLFLPLFLWQFLFDLLYQNFFPKYIIDRILSYIYISVCKSILSIQRIDFSLVTRNIFHTLPYIYISVSESLLRILKIGFSLITRNIFHTLPYIYISVSKSILSILKIDFSLVTRRLQVSYLEKVASLFSHISPTQRLTTMEKLSPGSFSLSPFERTTLEVTTIILVIYVLNFICQRMLVTRRLQVSYLEKVASLFSHISPTQRLTTMENLSPGCLSLSHFVVTTIIILSFYIPNCIDQSMLVSMVKSLYPLSHLSPTPRSTTKEKCFNFLRSPFCFHDETLFLFCNIIIIALEKFFSKYLDTSFFTSADFPSWLHILFEKDFIKNDTRTETKDIQIKRGEVEFVLSNIGISLSKEEDQIKDCMSHEEFSTLFDQTEPGLHEIEEAFSVFDQNRDGFIDAKELQTVLINLGLREGTDVNACKSMIDRHDRNCKGKIDQRDFFKLLESALL